MINQTGIDAHIQQLLMRILAKYPEILSVKLYGSRAKGSYHARSDLDLVVFGDQIDRFIIAAILLDIDDSDIPYLVNLQNYSDIKNRKLIEHIDRVGIVIYERGADEAV